ncbi:MAG: hypothetical protein ACRDNY_10595, partial [Gaiellaceae bacterium]
PEAWEQARRRQRAAHGRLRFEPGRLAETLAELPEAVVRPSAGVAYTPGETVSQGSAPSDAAARLVEAIRQQLDPNGVLT